MEGFSFYSLESENEIEMARECISLYIPKTASERFFEDVCQESSENQEAASGAIKHIKNAIKAIQEMIKRAIDSVVTFIQTMFMDKEEKSQFIKFKEKVKQNPEFANKKVTVKDFREINRRYSAAVKEIEAAAASVKQADEARRAQIVEQATAKANKIINEVSKSAATVYSVDLALRMAEGNRDVAKMIQKKLEEEEGIMKEIENQLGADRAADFKKKIDSTTHLISLQRIKVRLLMQWHKDMGGAMRQASKDFQELFSMNTDTMSNLKRGTHMNIADDLIGSYNHKTGSNLTKSDIVKKGLEMRSEYNKIKRDSIRDAKNKMDNYKKKEAEKKKKIKKMRDFFGN